MSARFYTQAPRVQPLTQEQQQVMRFAQQNVLSGNDEAMQALAVLARQFKA